MVTGSAEVANCQCFLRVTAANGSGSEAFAAKGTPGFRPPRLGPRPFSISLVISFVGSSVWMLKPLIAHSAARPPWLAPRLRVTATYPDSQQRWALLGAT